MQLAYIKDRQDESLQEENQTSKSTYMIDFVGNSTESSCLVLEKLATVEIKQREKRQLLNPEKK